MKTESGWLVVPKAQWTEMGHWLRHRNLNKRPSFFLSVALSPCWYGSNQTKSLIIKITHLQIFHPFFFLLDHREPFALLPSTKESYTSDPTIPWSFGRRLNPMLLDWLVVCSLLGPSPSLLCFSLLFICFINIYRKGHIWGSVSFRITKASWQRLMCNSLYSG